MNYLRGSNCISQDNEYSYLYIYILIICCYLVYMIKGKVL